ncbi:hypothetical protein ACN42_g9332, partial [Penicillium freii]
TRAVKYSVSRSLSALIKAAAPRSGNSRPWPKIRYIQLHIEAVWIKRCKEANSRERRVPCPNPRPILRITEAFAMGLYCPCLGWGILIPGAPKLVNPK